MTIWPVLRKATDCGPWLLWIALHAVDERVEGGVPTRRASSLPAALRSSGVVARSGAVEHRERFPALGAGHAEVHRIARSPA